MIEIAFDGNSGLTYKGKPYPILKAENLGHTDIRHYIDFALKILPQYKNTPYLIIKEDAANFCLKKMGLALFIASCLTESDLECVVFKVKDQKAAFESYKPYIAISVGIKYALRLISKAPFTIYKELKCLNYLNFSIKENYQTKSTVYTMSTGCDRSIDIKTHTVFDAILYVSVLKILSLADSKANINIEVFETNRAEKIDQKTMAYAILDKISKYIEI